MSGTTPLERALHRGRDAVEAYRHRAEVLGDSWAEEHATTELLHAAAPQVRFAAFSRPQEGKVGADWMWWWRDRSGECYGTLVQAKRIHAYGTGSWWFDLRYPGESDRQLRRLIDSAHRLGVAPVYVLYCGDGGFRNGFACSAPFHAGEACPRCRGVILSVSSDTDCRRP